MTIELGSKVRDKVTGFEGIAIGETRWLHGCLRYTVQPQELDKDGNQKATASFDEPQLIVLAGPAKTKVQATASEQRKTGGPAPEPARRKDARR
jgi:hypothetical protein